MRARKRRQSEMESQADITRSLAKETKLQPSSQDAANMISDEEVALRIQDLPQELQDNILEALEEFQVPQNLVTITSAYKPPLPLQLSQKIRAKFAREYYGTASFRCELNWGLLYDWALSLTAEHREMVARVQRTAVVPYDLTPFEIIDSWKWCSNNLLTYGLTNVALDLFYKSEPRDGDIIEYRVACGSDGPVSWLSAVCL